MDRGDAPPLIMVGGVPGAGKSTAIARALPYLSGVEALDSEDERRRLSAIAPGVPYDYLRPMVHALHQSRAIAELLRGPAGRNGLVVHDPATRPARLKIIGQLAQLRGWRPVLIFIDVDRDLALAGQRARGRLVDPDRFDGHWRRWSSLRTYATGTDEWRDALAVWPEWHWVDRDHAAGLIRSVLRPAAEAWAA
ncbi:AAA family ATPase [Microlunatus speluncae]|uniref:AAA family ATPase n=1 Tax=Microlunatus speluncae TaxID=2594267 RepID=UPI001266170E|nr:AAA family ATPase [Microlunatus speluncae]